MQRNEDIQGRRGGLMNVSLTTPVAPMGMDIAFHYACPFCQKVIRVSSPLKPVVISCPQCHKQFPIVPVDDALIKFMQVITAEGRAAACQEFV